MSIISQRLFELGLVLPKPAPAVAAYVPYVVSEKFIFISGQLPLRDGALAAKGRLGQDLTIEEGYAAAKLCALNILAQLNVATDGQLDEVSRCIKIGGFVASANNFFQQPKVINGASELIESVFGINGKHSRTAVGVSNLPLEAAVEIDAIFSLR